jgi:hypothetical protein
MAALLLFIQGRTVDMDGEAGAAAALSTIAIATTTTITAIIPDTGFGGQHALPCHPLTDGHVQLPPHPRPVLAVPVGLPPPHNVSQAPALAVVERELAANDLVAVGVCVALHPVGALAQGDDL